MTARMTEGDGDPEHLDDAFALLGNETRMAILRALWDEHESFTSTADTALPFTELRERVGVADPGQFNYHLNQLVDEFVRRTEAGYVLQPNAVHMLRAAIVRGGIGEVSVSPTRTDDRCPFCGADMEALYADDMLVVRCTVCHGDYAGEASPVGTLVSSHTFPKPGVVSRTGQELWDALIAHATMATFGFLRGICPECATRPDVTIDVCTDHATNGVCEECGSTQTALAIVRCERCNFVLRVPAWIPALAHPEVIWFFHRKGVDAYGGITADMFKALLTAEETLQSVDPLRLEEAVELDGNELTVVVDDRLTVHEVRT